MKKSINVLFMQSQTYYGADSSLHGSLMRLLDRDRFEVHVACNPGETGQKSDALRALEAIPDLHIRPTLFGPTVHHRSRREILSQLPASSLPSLRSLAGLAFYLRKHKIDIIHGTEKPRDAFYGWLLARATGARLVVHLHVAAEDWLSPLTKFAMKRADALIGISSFVSASIEHMGYAPEKIFTVLNGLDLSRWRFMENADIRSEFGIPNSRTLILIASRIFYWKGHTRLLQALARVKQTCPNFTLLVVGEDDPRGAPGKRGLTQDLKALVEDLGLTGDVIFAGYRRDVQQIMAGCDIFAQPSEEEPFGMVYLEAMIMKKAVIAQATGGTPEIVEHGKSGLLSAADNIDELAANLKTLIVNPALRRQMGEHGYQQVHDHFTAQRMTKDMEYIYQTLVGSTQTLGIPYSG